MERIRCLEAVYDELAGCAVVTIMGAVAVELYSLGHRPNFFYLEHAMGLALVFEARIGTRTIEGVDFLRLNSLGLVDDFRVMVRPHSALEALMEAMVPAIERVLAEQSSAG